MWRRPGGLIFVQNRLYMFEMGAGTLGGDDDDDEDCTFEMGRQIFSLSPAGETLQTCYLGLEAGRRIKNDLASMAVFDGKLVLLDDSETLIALHGF